MVVDQLEGPLGVAGEVAHGDQGAVVLGGVAGLLQGAVQVAGGAVHRAGGLDQREPVVGGVGLVAAGLEAIGGLDEGLDVGPQRRDARGPAGAGQPLAVGAAPEQLGGALVRRLALFL